MKKSFLQSITLLLAFTASSSLWAMEREKKKNHSPQNTVFVFDLDQVVSDKGNIIDKSLFYILGLIKSSGIITKHPSLLFNYIEIKAKGIEIYKGNPKENLQPINGTSNIIHKLMKWLEDEKYYKNMVKYTSQLTEAFVNPVPNIHTLHIIKKLKEMDFTVIFATNQDDIQNKFWREKMLRQGYDAAELFDGGVCNVAKYNIELLKQKIYEAAKALNISDTDTETKNKIKKIQEQKLFKRLHTQSQKNEDDYTFYVTKHTKPQIEYYKVMCKLAEKLNTDYNEIFFIDDKEKNVDSENLQKNVTGIHFESADQLLEQIKELIPDFEI